MIDGTAIVGVARGYIGTPFQHQARLKGVRVDCIGLLVGVGREIGATISDSFDYGRCPNPRRFLAQMAKQLDRVSGPDPLALEADPSALACARVGDLLLFHYENKGGEPMSTMPRHCGFLGPGTIIHTYADAGGVREHSLDDKWRKRVHSVWRFRWPS